MFKRNQLAIYIFMVKVKEKNSRKNACAIRLSNVHN